VKKVLQFPVGSRGAAGKQISLRNLKITVEINIYGKKDGKKQ